MVQLLNENGTVTKYYQYDAFGNEINEDENDTNPWRYCGEYYDKETGTVYLRARYYDPGYGRFTTRDTYTGEANDPLSLNLYTYCGNEPVMCVDPSGHCWRFGWRQRSSTISAEWEEYLFWNSNCGKNNCRKPKYVTAKKTRWNGKYKGNLTTSNKAKNLLTEMEVDKNDLVYRGNNLVSVITRDIGDGGLTVGIGSRRDG